MVSCTHGGGGGLGGGNGGGGGGGDGGGLHAWNKTLLVAVLSISHQHPRLAKCLSPHADYYNRGSP